MLAAQPYFSRSTITPSLAMESRNGQDRMQVEAGMHELRTRSRPATASSFTDRYHERVAKAEMDRRTNLFARSTNSAFCPRPQELPL